MNVPKIRFSDFSDDYISKKLKDVFNFYRGNTLSKSDLVDNGNNKCILYGELYTKYSAIANIIYSRTNNNNKNLIYGKKYDVLMPCSGETALDISTSTCLQDDNVIIGGDLTILRPIKDLGNYLSYYLCYKKKIEIARFAQGDSVVHLYADKIKKLSLTLPTYEEQKNVSRVLELLDKKIELQSKKIEDLKLFKLYIRKTIFLLNADNNIKLKDIVNCESSNITLTDIENDNGMYPVYGATGFIKNIKNHKFGSEYIAIVKDGAGVGRTMICPKNSSILATMNALIVKNNYPLNYICEMINTISFDKYIVGSGIPHIYFKDYGNEEFMLHNINDAIKFNNIFKCIDKKIELLNIKLDKLNTLKKGLMQNMFV